MPSDHGRAGNALIGEAVTMTEDIRTLLADVYAHLLSTVPYDADSLPDYDTEPYVLLRRLSEVLEGRTSVDRQPWGARHEYVAGPERCCADEKPTNKGVPL